MPRFRCYRCQDKARPGVFREFFVPEGRALCPKCGAGYPALTKLVDVHWQRQHPDGPIFSDFIEAPDRYFIQCMPDRPYLALPLEVETFSASAEVSAVTCRECRTPEWEELAKRNVEALKVLAREKLSYGMP